MPRALFIGREREQQLYQEFLNETSPWVLAITGLGGSGKSMLLLRFEKQTPPTILVIKHNFAAEALRIDSSTRKALSIDPLTIIETFASQVRYNCDPQQYTTFRDTLVKCRHQLTEQRTQIIQSVRVGNDSRLEGGRFQISIDEVDEAVRKAHYHVRELATGAFYTLMDTFELDRLVILLDSCEWLNEPVNSEVGPWVMNEIILELHDRMQQRRKQCHAVMASSLHSQLKNIAEQDREDLELSELDEIAVKQCLETIGIQDPELRQRIYEITHGNASCVSIICGLWQDLKEKPSSVAELPEFRRKFNERAQKQFIDKHILDERLKTPFDELTRYGVLLRSFTRPLLIKVFSERQELQDSESQARWYFTQFVNYLYIKDLGNYRYTLLELLREVLAEAIRRQEPKKWERYHQRALEYLQSDPKLSQASSYSSDWYYHTIACQLTDDEEQNISYWQEALQKAKVRGVGYNAMLEAARDKTLMFTSVAHAAQALE
jgi:hypothetical protein